MDPRQPRSAIRASHDPAPGDAGGLDSMSAVEKATVAVAAVFVVIGVLGFIPGVTTNYDRLEWFGPESEALLLGVFQVSILHNLVHLGFGLLGVAAARAIDSSRVYLVGGGALYAVLWLYGLLVDKDSEANFVPLNTADDWLHLILAVVMIGLGLALTDHRRGDIRR
jgi:arginine exporter protein ArgO